MKTYNSFVSSLLGFLLFKYDTFTGFPIAEPQKEYAGLILKKVYKSQNQDNLTGVGLYKNKNNEYKIIKYVNFKTHNSVYQHLYNEYYFLKTLSKLINSVNSNLHIPLPERIIEESNRLTLISEYCEGIPLTTLPNNKKIQTMKEIIDTLEHTSVKNLDNFPKRTPLYIFVTFHILLFKLLLKNFSQAKTYLSYLIMFYRQYVLATHGDLVISHRDLHSDNVLYSKSQITLIDPEVMALCEKHTDLAILVKAYVSSLGNDFLTFLQNELKTISERKRFLALSVYYAIQMMSISNKNETSYKESETYLKHELYTVQDVLLPHICFVEIIHSFGLKILSRIKQPKTQTSLILCYHSITSDGWRFATRPELFEEQMKIVSKRNPVSITTLLAKSKPGIAVTFDDGYEDFLTNALPILKKYHIPATMFVLGNPENANHSELQNTKKMLSISQIKSLHKQGIEIGFHTATHNDMRKMSDAELEYEIITSKENLENKLGFKIRYFAYPRGIYDKRIIAKVKKAGYEKAFTVDGGSVNKNGSDYLVNRVSIEGTTTPEEFNTLLSPLGILFETTYMETLKIKEMISFSLKRFIAPKRKDNLS